MATTTRAAQSYGGPRAGTTWLDLGMAGRVGGSGVGATIASTTLEDVSYVVPTPNLIVQPGDVYLDQLAGDNIICGLYGAYVTPSASWAANIANLTVRLMLRRAGAIIGGGAFAGWAAAANPALTAWVPTFVPWLLTNTALLPGRIGGAVGTAAGQAFLPLQPLDVITAQFVTTASVTLTSLLQMNYTLL